MKERSTQAVVGLWGNERTMTRGLGHDSSQALHQPVEERLARVGGVVGLGSGARQRHLAHVGAGEQRAPDVDRVRRRGHQGGVAGPDQHPHEVREALLGADGRHHLGLGVELDRELAPVEVGDGAAELGDAPGGGVAVVARVVRRLGELVHRDVGRGQVRVPEAEVDHVTAGSPRRRLQVVDRGEDVGRQPVDPAELHRGSLRPGPSSPGPGDVPERRGRGHQLLDVDRPSEDGPAGSRGVQRRHRARPAAASPRAAGRPRSPRCRRVRPPARPPRPGRRPTR